MDSSLILLLVAFRVLIPASEELLKASRNRLPRKSSKTGVREKARFDSIERIIKATRKLFVELGYDATTLQRIAADSNLAMSTLFHYVKDKRDLLYLIFNDEFEKVTEAGLKAYKPSQGFREKILNITAPYYKFVARDPKLSRILLSESQQHSPGFHLPRFLEIRSRLIRRLEELVVEAQATEEIRSPADANDIAMSIFFCFSAAGRWWIATDNPKWRQGHKNFERIFDVILTGLDLAEVQTPQRKSRN